MAAAPSLPAASTAAGAWRGKFWFGARSDSGASGALLLSALHKAARGCDGLELRAAVRAMLACGWGATTLSYLLHTVLPEDVLMGAPGCVGRLVRDGLAALGCADRGDLDGATEYLGRLCQHLVHCRRSRLPAAIMSLALFDTPLCADWAEAIGRLEALVAGDDLSAAAHALQSALLLVSVEVRAGVGKARRLTKAEKSRRIFEALVDGAPTEMHGPLRDLLSLSAHFHHEHPLLFFAALCLRVGRGLLTADDWASVAEADYRDAELWSAAALLEPIDVRAYVDGLPAVVFDKHTSAGGSYQQFITTGAVPAERFWPSAALWSATTAAVADDLARRNAYEATAGRKQSKSAKRAALHVAALARLLGQEPRGAKRRAESADRRPTKRAKHAAPIHQ